MKEFIFRKGNPLMIEDLHSSRAIYKAKSKEDKELILELVESKKILTTRDLVSLLMELAYEGSL